MKEVSKGGSERGPQAPDAAWGEGEQRQVNLGVVGHD